MGDTIGVNGVPFVVLADRVRIYMGGYFSGMSSYAIPNPEILVEDITSDGFTIRPPIQGLAPVVDPRNDTRITTVFKETARWVP